MSNLRTAAEQALQYRKKPVVIEAFQMTRERRKDNRDWPAWLNEAWCKPFDEVGAVSCEDYPNSVSLTDRLVIRTLEGVMTVGWDDWIIRGVAGELYACKPDIFAATYESVALAAEQPQPEVQPVRGWQPIATAPRDSKRPLYLAKFDGKGEMQAIDFDGGWEFWRESWEMPHINGWDWTSASGIEDPTHWAYQDEGAPPATPLPEAQPVAVVTECDHYSTEWLRVAPPPSAPCPHIRSSGVGEWATNWCALNGPPSAPEPSRTLTQDERDVFDAAERRSTKVVVPEPSKAQVEAAWRAIPASHEDSRVSVITKGDVWVMLRAAAAARNNNPA